MTPTRKRVKDLRDKMAVTEVYYCVHKSDPIKPKPTAKDPNPDPYVLAMLVDATGRVGGYIWERSQWDRFEVGDYVEVDAVVRGDATRRRLKVTWIRKDEGEHDPKEFIRYTHKDLHLLLGKVEQRIGDVRSESHRSLLRAYIERYGEQLTLLPFVRKGVPGNYMGGLLVMLARVLDEIERECEENPDLDFGLLVTAAIVAGCGKVRAFTLGVNETELSDEGLELTEGDLCQVMLLELAFEAGIPLADLRPVQHCIAARRGRENLPAGFRSEEAELLFHIWQHVVNVTRAREVRAG